jgi:uncharacterized protein (TIGR03382 family)
MPHSHRPFARWIILGFLGLSVLLMLAGQTMAVIDYELAARLGLQERIEDVGAYGMQVNRAFGAADTFVYIPLMLLSMVGLLRRRRWSLLTTAAVAGISAYWSTTILFMLLFLPDTPGYSYAPGVEIWGFVCVYAIFGLWVLGYLLVRGEALIARR